MSRLLLAEDSPITVPAQQLSAPPAQFDPDAIVIATWLHGKSENTRSAYAGDVERFRVFVAKRLAEVTLADLQLFDADLASCAPATRARRLAAVKSLFAFAQRMGAIALNPAAALQVKKPASAIAERILPEDAVKRMIACEGDPRLKAIIRVYYVCGLRASEVALLRWKHLVGSEKKGGELHIVGKGGKQRVSGVPADLWRELAALHSAITAETRLIPSRIGGDLDRKAVWRAVKRAARRAGLGKAPSPHWLRHSHASHALHNGASLAAVRDGLGHADIKTTSRYVHARPGETSAGYIRSC